MRTFKQGDVQHYRVTLTVRSEVDGRRPTTVEGKTYAEPFADLAEASLSWEATRLVVSVDPDGAAQVEEKLHSFSELLGTMGSTGMQPVGKSLADLLRAWNLQLQSPLRYREAQNGQISGLGADAGPVFDNAPAVLTLWLRRALRPSALLPGRPAREGERWSEPRAVRLPPWTDVQGTESGEWLAGPLPERSISKLISLHVVQQISGRVPSAAQEGSAPVPPGDARFHAESLSAVVHLGAPLYGGYGSLFSATRSASREVTRVVEGMPNLAEAIFRARISVEIRIQIIE